MILCFKTTKIESKVHVRAKKSINEFTQKYGRRKKPAPKVPTILQIVPILPSLPTVWPHVAISLSSCLIRIGGIIPSI